MERPGLHFERVAEQIESFGFRDIDAKVLLALLQSACDPTTLARRLHIPRTKVYESIHRLRRDRWIFPVEKRGRQILLRALAVPELLQRLEVQSNNEAVRRAEILKDLQTDLAVSLSQESSDDGIRFMVLEEVTDPAELRNRIVLLVKSCRKSLKMTLPETADLSTVPVNVATSLVERGVDVRIVLPKRKEAYGVLRHKLSFRDEWLRQCNDHSPRAFGVLVVDDLHAVVLFGDGPDSRNGTFGSNPVFLSMAQALFESSWNIASPI